MSGGKGQQSTTSTTGPPAYLQPYYESLAKAGSGKYTGQGPNYYPGVQVAPFSPLQEQGFSQIQNTAIPAAQQVANSGAGMYNALESGSLLNPATNPALQGMANLADQQIQNNLASQFASAGRNIEGSAPIQASQMSDVAANVYGGAYNQTLADMTSGLGATGSMEASQAAPGQLGVSAGGQIQNQAQNLIGANQNQYGYYQMLPYTQMSGLSSLLSGIPGSSMTTPYYTNPAGSALSGAATGAAIGSVVPGIGTAIGAIGGGLLGLLGGGGGL